MDAYIPCDCLPGLMDGWLGPYQWSWDEIRWYDWPEVTTVARDGLRLRLDLRREECRDRVSRVLARVLGVPVGATAPLFLRAGYMRGEDPAWLLSSQVPGSGPAPVFRASEHSPYAAGKKAHLIPALATIAPDSPDRDALALAAVARHIGAEIRAGRIQPGVVAP